MKPISGYSGMYKNLFPYKKGRRVSPPSGFSIGTPTVVKIPDAAFNAAVYGGFTDGTYGYHTAYYGASATKIVRYLLSEFAGTPTFTYISLSGINAAYKGYAGGIINGGFAYLIPYGGDPAHGKMLRINLSDFTASGVTALDLATINAGLVGFGSGFSHGNYVYIFTYFNGTDSTGHAVRIDVNDFTSTGVTRFDLADVDAELKGPSWAFTDGTYGYVVPYNYSYATALCGGKFARIELADFATTGVDVLDLELVNANLVGFYGGFQAGGYAYLCTQLAADSSAATGYVCRVDLTAWNAGGVSYSNLATGNPARIGFLGMIPSADGDSAFLPGHFTSDFNNSSLVTKISLSPLAGNVASLDVASLPSNYSLGAAGFANGSYVYVVSENGYVARFPQ